MTLSSSECTSAEVDTKRGKHQHRRADAVPVLCNSCGAAETSASSAVFWSMLEACFSKARDADASDPCTTEDCKVTTTYTMEMMQTHLPHNLLNAMI